MDNKKILLLMFFGIFLISLMYSVSAQASTITITSNASNGTTWFKGGSNQSINFSIVAELNSSVNLSFINISVPAGMTIWNANITNNTNWTCDGGVINGTYANCSSGVSDTYVAINISLNITLNSSAYEQNHSVVILLTDNFTGTNETLENILVDGIQPTISMPAYTNATAKKNTANLTLNISIVDAGSGASQCWVSINGTNQTFDVDGDNWCNTTLGNLTNMGDGNATIIIWVNDSVNNMNVSHNTSVAYVVQIDTTNPLPTATCTPTNPTDNGEIVTCSCSGTDATAGINSSLTTAGTSTVTSTAGTTSYICSLTDYAGNTATSITTYTVSGGGGSGIASSTKSNLFTTLTPEKVSIMKNFNEETGVKEIQIQVKDEIQNVKITVSKFDEKPVSVSVEKTGKVHKYFQIKTENLETDLKKATVTIQVEKSWISNNSLNKDDIALFKFDNSSNNWNELTTTYKEEDDEYYYYDAELTSFSYFAISEKVVIEEEIVEEKTEEIIDGNKQEESINKGLILWWILVIVLILAILILILIIIRLIKPKRGDIDYIQPFKPIIQQPATEGEEWQQ